jgi:raffinose/stachyose/melibiose transport system permease protein
LIQQRRPIRWNSGFGLGLTVVLLTMLCFLWIYPFLWLVSASLKNSLDIFSSGLNLVPHPVRWGNYLRAWVTAGFASSQAVTARDSPRTAGTSMIRSAAPHLRQ